MLVSLCPPNLCRTEYTPCSRHNRRVCCVNTYGYALRRSYSGQFKLWRGDWSATEFTFRRPPTSKLAVSGVLGDLTFQEGFKDDRKADDPVDTENTDEEAASQQQRVRLIMVSGPVRFP
eukprot:6099788-Pyramimonas_sp.AAC.2